MITLRRQRCKVYIVSLPEGRAHNQQIVFIPLVSVSPCDFKRLYSFMLRKLTVIYVLFVFQVLGRSRSLSLPRRSVSSVSPQSPVSPYTTTGRSPTRTPLERHTSWVEKPAKPPSPWEAAAKSPLGLVDEAFAFQDLMQVPAAVAHRRSLPEPPLEWKQRVSNEPVVPSPLTPLSPRPVASPTRAAPASPSKPTFYGPPFRPAQPLTTNTLYPGTGSLGRKSRPSNSLPPLRISRVM